MTDQIQHSIKPALLKHKLPSDESCFGMMTAMQKEIVVLFNSVFFEPDLDVLHYPPLSQPRYLDLSID